MNDQPKTLSQSETFVELLGHTQSTMADVRRLHERHAELLERCLQPARMSAHTLTPGDPTDLDQGSMEEPSLSLGVLNPNGCTVYLGLSGGTASLAAEGVPVGPNQFLVLPVAVAQLEIGADPADLAALGATTATQTALVFVFRFRQVQPAFLGVGV
jgi:hypothetical protein